tara:strand:- start:1321 stop:1686 length:366 start_codon:yes stop_codon:yes gene_type:complete
MSKEMLREIIDDNFFQDSIIWAVIPIIRSKGTVTDGTPIVKNLKAIVQNINASELENLGLGIYTDKDNLSIFINQDIDFALNNFATYEGKTYKFVKAMPWRGYGFRNYIITQYQSAVLNDN